MCTLAWVVEIFLDGQPQKRETYPYTKIFSDEITQSDDIMSTWNIPDNQMIL